MDKIKPTLHHVKVAEAWWPSWTWSREEEDRGLVLVVWRRDGMNGKRCPWRRFSWEWKSGAGNVVLEVFWAAVLIKGRATGGSCSWEELVTASQALRAYPTPWYAEILFPWALRVIFLNAYTFFSAFWDKEELLVWIWGKRIKTANHNG